MPINGLQMQARELGRIRLGEKGPKGNPVKLDCFRLTSQNKTLIDRAAELYGGTVRPWVGHDGQWEVVIKATELPFMATPAEVSQWYEKWNAGGIERRCTGTEESISGGTCLCDPTKRDCKLTTRLSVILYQLPGLGVWRLESHGWYAATELPADAQWLIRLARDGHHVKATLAIEKRTIKKQGEPTKNFIVPVIRTDMTLGQLMTGGGTNTLPVPQKPPQRQLEAPVVVPAEPFSPATAPTFRKYMVQFVQEAWAEADLLMSAELLGRIMGGEQINQNVHFNGSAFKWTSLSNENLMRVYMYAKTGEIYSGSQQALSDTLESMKEVWEQAHEAD